MAESDPKHQEEDGGSWWESWIQAAKETSASAYEFVKRDLGEFTCTVQSDTEHALTATGTTVKETIKAENASTAKNRMKEGINTLFQGITKVLTIPPDDGGEKPILVVSSESAIYDRSKARLHAIQVDPGTYLDKPSGSPEHFKEWCRYFDIESKKGDISELLVSKVEVRALYTKLVPAEIAHATFWQRYFYKLHQMALDEARKQALIKRAESSGRSNSINDDWGSADEDDIEIVQLKDVYPKSPVGNTPASIGKPLGSPVSEIPMKTEHYGGSELSAETPKAVQKIEMKAEPIAPSQSLALSIETNLETVQKTKEGAVDKEQLTSSGPSIDKILVGDSSKVDDNPTDKVLPEKIEESPITTILDSPKNLSKENVKKTELQKTENNTNNNAYSSPCLPETVFQPSNTVDKNDELDYSDNFDSKIEIGTKSDNIEAKPIIVENLAVDTSDQSNKPKQEIDQSQSGVSQIVESKSTDSKMKVLPPSGSDKKQEKVTSDIKTKDKGDMVIVGGDRISPTSDSSGNKDTSIEDDWDKDFDLDVTEEELQAAEELAKKMGDNLDLEVDDDWENWE